MIAQDRMRLYFTRPYERAIRKAALRGCPPGDGGGDRRRSRCTAGRPRDRWHPQVALGRFQPGKAGRHSRDLLLVPAPGAVYMLTAYAKADRDDLTAADRKALTRLVAEIERERQRE